MLLLKTLLLRAWQTAFIAVRALRRNKMRSILTALGIIIGVASVVAMVAIGNGAQANITKQVSALGQNLLTVFAGSKRFGGVNVVKWRMSPPSVPKIPPPRRPSPTDATGPPASSANRRTI
jgi:hypothetical protein